MLVPIVSSKGTNSIYSFRTQIQLSFPKHLAFKNCVFLFNRFWRDAPFHGQDMVMSCHNKASDPLISSVIPLYLSTLLTSVIYSCFHRFCTTVHTFQRIRFFLNHNFTAIQNTSYYQFLRINPAALFTATNLETNLIHQFLSHSNPLFCE